MVDWKDPQTVSAVAMYVRLAVGAGFACVLLYMLIVDRIDLAATIKALVSLMIVDRGAIGALSLLQRRNDNS